MNRTFRPASLRAIVVLTLVGLALAGCGRKGGLDLPPQPSARPLAETAPVADPDGNTASGKGAALFNAAPGDDSQPVASGGRKKSFLLDPLLD